ncbi:transmembrane anterior posterior transformation protein 1 homolog isoform X1 [Gorilla gorilla gorilla]|uniref:transmembrane anterior posterior transformation protein 1 homolog isoform X1 n=1 Tax=Gorilla gorilla gorilla TaxID=9595 RepID=UPI002445F626|nr:transmembrane anterior posterior transformation protein 1 homolog isoform X1 [Gorilla gorilla gorilla]
MQKRWNQNSGHAGPALVGVGDLEAGPRRRGRASSAKTWRAAPAHSGHRVCKRGPERAAGHLADCGQRWWRPPPRGSTADPPPAAAIPGPLLPGPRPEPRRRPLCRTAQSGCMEPGAVPRPAEPATARETAARHGEGRKKMAAAVAAAAAAAASHASLTPMARAGRRAADGGGGGDSGSGEGRGEAGRGPAGGRGWREAAGTVCCARNMAAAPGEGGGGGVDGPQRDGRGEAEQPGGSGGQGPPPAPQLTETLGFYESDRRRERRRGRTELSLLRFLSAELTRGYFLEHNEAKYTERRERVYTCLRIPRELEKLMVFGIFLCLDAFLYVFTLLPLRVFLALFRLLTLPCYGLRDRRLLQPAQVCDILKGVILVICYFMMHYVDYSMMYHLIRGQSVIKLYIIYNMLEVADRLFSSFGQDILDALYWTATEPKERKRAHIGVIPHFFMAVLYVFLHAILIMVQATTLNVAFNSHNKSLLTIMMSNNFVEIKGSVFKKFEKNNLFQMSNSDIKERFTNYVLLLIVCLRNMEQFSWNPDHLWVLFPDVCMVIASEIAVDIVKHAFITKFNDITADVYSEYRASLAFDLVSSRQKNAYTDYSDSVARRMGFIPLPLAVLLIRVVTSSIKVQGILSYACVILFYFGLISLKVLNSIVLLGKSCQYVKEAKMEEKLSNPPSTCTPGKPSSKSQNKCKPSQGLSTEENLSASITKQPIHQKENIIPLLVTSTSDQFLTTPDGDEKDITQDNSELKHRSSKKDLLEIDRFTICGNRID